MSATIRTDEAGLHSRKTAFVEFTLFCVFIGLYLIPVFIGKYTLTHDGPAHLYNATLLKYFWTGHDAFIGQYYQHNSQFSTNLAGNGLIATLLYVVPDFAAEKILHCLYLIGLPFAFRYAVRHLNPAASVYSFLIFPFLYNKVFVFGFYSQLLSFVVLFWMLGKWLSSSDPLSSKNRLTLMALALLIELLHPLTFLFSILLTGSFLLNHLIDWQPGKTVRLPSVRTVANALGKYLLIYLPAGLLFFYFLVNNTTNEKIYFPHQQLDYLRGLLNLYEVIDTDDSWQATILFRLLVFGIGGLGVWALLWTLRKKTPHSHQLALGLIMGVTLVLYLAMPDRIAGGFIIRPRIAFLLYAFLILVLANFATSATRKTTWLVSSVLAAGFCIYQIYYYYQVHVLVADIVTAQRFIPNQSVMLPYTGIHYHSDFKKVTRLPYPFIHVSNYLCLDKQSVCLHNYQAQYNYFPVHGKHWNFSMQSIADSLPPVVKPSIAEFEQLSHTRITHVVLLGINEQEPMLANGKVREELKREFRQLYISPMGKAIVYERKQSYLGK